MRSKHSKLWKKAWGKKKKKSNDQS